jgi:hypothetical protein
MVVVHLLHCEGWLTTTTSGPLSFKDLPVYFKFITNAAYYPELSSVLTEKNGQL